MKLNQLSVILFFLAFQSSCILLTKKSMIIESISDKEVLEYARKNKFDFDIHLRIKNIYYLNNIKKYGFSSFQFVSLFGKDGRLLSVKSGENCEIAIMKYLTDSIKAENYQYKNCDSCDFRTLQRDLSYEISSDVQDDLSSYYKVVIGWASFYKNVAMLNKRTLLVTEKIKELKHKNIDAIVIGLNVDPKAQE